MCLGLECLRCCCLQEKREWTAAKLCTWRWKAKMCSEIFKSKVPPTCLGLECLRCCCLQEKREWTAAKHCTLRWKAKMCSEIFKMAIEWIQKNVKDFLNIFSHFIPMGIKKRRLLVGSSIVDWAFKNTKLHTNVTTTSRRRNILQSAVLYPVSSTYIPRL